LLIFIYILSKFCQALHYVRVCDRAEHAEVRAQRLIGRVPAQAAHEDFPATTNREEGDESGRECL
jgi:hypothetical protein